MDQLLPNLDPVYTGLSAPDQISHEAAQLANNNSAITQIQEFEETFNMYQQQWLVKPVLGSSKNLILVFKTKLSTLLYVNLTL